MRPLRRWAARLAGLWRVRQAERRMALEFETHLAEAAEDYRRAGLPADEARRRARLDFGPVESAKEAYRDQYGLPAVTSLGADIVFGWRQWKRHPLASAVAILSLALAAGAVTVAFRLVDHLFLRPLPVTQPERLFYLSVTAIDGNRRPDVLDEFDYPTFLRYREVLGDRADSMVVGMAGRQDAAFGAQTEPEKIWRQFVSGNFFPLMGLRPEAGRLLAPSDDRAPGAGTVAVLSYDFWTRRFQRNPAVIGSTLRMADTNYEIAGIAPEGFTGTEPGQMTDLFIPATMNVDALSRPGWSWFRLWLRPRPGVTPEQLRQPLQAEFSRSLQESVRAQHRGTPQSGIDRLLKQRLLVLPAGHGASTLQREYRRPLWILGGLVVLVLLVACANVASLVTARSAARVREMAVRVSIGAGRGRLLRMLLIESGMTATAAAVLGVAFAAWGTPLVVSMLRVPADPVRMALATGWREAAFALVLALVVTVLFGLAPALRTSAADPARSLAATREAQSRRPLMNGLVAAQVAFSVLVLFIGGLFVATFHRLSARPLGFAPERVLIAGTNSTTGPVPPRTWTQLAQRVAVLPGVSSATVASWPLLSGNGWTAWVRLPGRADEARPPYFLRVAPGFFDTMRVPRLQGRAFRDGDQEPHLDSQGEPAAGQGIVNQTFARTYFGGAGAVGRVVQVLLGKDRLVPMVVVGVVGDAVYRDLREPIRPTVYVPLETAAMSALLVRTSVDPLSLAPAVRQTITGENSGFRVRTFETQENFVRWQLVRERLLAGLSGFFAAISLVLAALGLYGVLNYTVTLQRREIGIRMALGAVPSQVLSAVAMRTVRMVTLGAAAGLGAGILTAPFVETLLFQVKSSDPTVVTGPIALLLGVALVAGLPPALRALRTDPAETLRAE